MHVQRLLRWHTHRPVQSEAQWKDLFAGQFKDAPWDALSMHQGNSAMSIISRSAVGTAWLSDHVAPLARAVMQRLGAVTTMEIKDLSPGLRHGGGRVFTYSVPTVVVCKGGEQWEKLNQQDLSAPALTSLIDSFKRQLLDQVRAFTDTPEELQRWEQVARSVDLRPLASGRPMPIKLSLPNSKTGLRQDRWVMSRLDFEFQSEWRFEGDFSVGKLAGLGYGRVFREDVSEAIEKARPRAVAGVVS